MAVFVSIIGFDRLVEGIAVVLKDRRWEDSGGKVSDRCEGEVGGWSHYVRRIWDSARSGDRPGRVI